jgi:tetratricopeptide (TPR) repeat protein
LARPFLTAESSRSSNLLTRSLRIDPDHVLSLYLMGQVEALEGRTREALESTLRAVEVTPRDPDTHGALALRFAELGFYESSLHEIERAIALNSRWALPYRLRVDLLVRLQRFEDASQGLEELRGLSNPGSLAPVLEATLLY